MRGTRVIGAGALAIALVATAACTDAKTHVYSAQLYEQTSDCLDDYAALAVVNGETAASTCAPVCLVGGAGYYVSAVCAPYPDGFTVAGADAASDPICTAALAAKSCSAPADGGIEGGGDDGGGDVGTGDDGGDAAPSDGGGGDAAAD